MRKMGNTVRQGSAVIRNDLSAEYNKDPSTSLGMTIRENVWSEVRRQMSDVRCQTSEVRSQKSEV